MKEERKLARRLMYAIYGADEVFILKDRGMHINYAELSIMYVLDGDMPCSQKEIAEKMFIPLTTVNTIIKRWEKEGILIQIPIEGKRREMQIVLTDKGKEYAEQYLSFIYKAEEQAIKKTLEKYSAEFIDALECYGECLYESFKDMDY